MLEYQLSSVIHHWGNSVLSGHYTACRKSHLQDPNSFLSKWIKCDDDKVDHLDNVNSVTTNSINGKNSYLAIYEIVEKE